MKAYLNADECPVNKAVTLFDSMSTTLEYLIFPFYHCSLCVSLPFIQRNDRNLSSFVEQTAGNVGTLLSMLYNSYGLFYIHHSPLARQGLK